MYEGGGGEGWWRWVTDIFPSAVHYPSVVSRSVVHHPESGVPSTLSSSSRTNTSGVILTANSENIFHDKQCQSYTLWMSIY